MTLFNQCMAMNSFYTRLGVSNTATPAEIKKAYHKLSLKWHPDKNKEPEAQAKFQEISEAYKVLSDPDSRREYDISGTTTSSQTAQSAEQFVARMEKMKQDFEYKMASTELQAKHELEENELTHSLKMAQEQIKTSNEEIVKYQDKLKTEIFENMKDGYKYLIAEYEKKLNKATKKLNAARVKLQDIKLEHWKSLKNLNDTYGKPTEPMPQETPATPEAEVTKTIPTADDILAKIINLGDNAISKNNRFNSKSCNNYFKMLIPDLNTKQPTPAISSFFEKLLEKNGCTSKKELEAWINLRFAGDTQKYLLKINALADHQSSNKSSLTNSLATLQTNLTHLKKKLEKISADLTSLKSKLTS